MKPIQTLPLETGSFGFLRLPQILLIIPVSKSTWWAGVKSGRYPQPVRTLGARITAWRCSDIVELVETLSTSEADPQGGDP